MASETPILDVRAALEHCQDIYAHLLVGEAGAAKAHCEEALPHFTDFLVSSGPVDLFDRANENPLSDSGKWAKWLSAFGDLVVAGNECQAFVPGTSTAFRDEETYGPNVEFSLTVKAIGNSGSYIALIARASNGFTDTSGYAVRYKSSGTLELVRYAASDLPAIGTVLASMPLVLTPGDGIGISVLGSNLMAWHRVGALGTWAAVLVANDNTYTAAGRVSLVINQLISGSSWSVDDLYGGTVGGGMSNYGRSILESVIAALDAWIVAPPVLDTITTEDGESLTTEDDNQLIEEDTIMTGVVVQLQGFPGI